MLKLIKRILRELKKESRNEKAKTHLLNSEITEDFVKDMFKIADEYPNTQCVIETINAKIIIKSRLTDFDLYGNDELYKIPEIENTISIAKSVRRGRK